MHTGGHSNFIQRDLSYSVKAQVMRADEVVDLHLAVSSHTLLPHSSPTLSSPGCILDPDHRDDCSPVHTRSMDNLTTDRGIRKTLMEGACEVIHISEGYCDPSGGRTFNEVRTSYSLSTETVHITLLNDLPASLPCIHLHQGGFTWSSCPSPHPHPQHQWVSPGPHVPVPAPPSAPGS